MREEKNELWGKQEATANVFCATNHPCLSGTDRYIGQTDFSAKTGKVQSKTRQGHPTGKDISSAFILI